MPRKVSGVGACAHRLHVMPKLTLYFFDEANIAFQIELNRRPIPVSSRSYRPTRRRNCPCSPRLAQAGLVCPGGAVRWCGPCGDTIEFFSSRLALWSALSPTQIMAIIPRMLGLLVLLCGTVGSRVGTSECLFSREGCPLPDADPAASGENCCVTTAGSSDPNLNTCGGTRPTGLPFAGRSPVYARHGMAATSQPLTTQAALDILKAGGNAIDAAIAANAMEGVGEYRSCSSGARVALNDSFTDMSAQIVPTVEPMMCGMGGDLMALVYASDDKQTGNKTKKLFGLNSSGRSSNSTSYDDLMAELERLGFDSMPSKGPLPFTVPGAVKGWCMLHDRFGKMDWEKLFDAAIHYASEGFPVSPVIASEWGLTDARAKDVTSKGKYPNAADGFFDTFAVRDPVTNETRPPRAGEIFRNPDLAQTLRELAAGGCDAFYNGSVAQKIDSFAQVAGTRVTAADMASHRSAWVEPVSTTYRDRYRVFELPPNPQGLAALQQLNILEGFNLTELGHNTAEYLHVQIEAKKLAFADRAKYYADPDFVKIPVEGLLSKEYAAQRRALIDMDHAAQRVDAGVPTGHSSDQGTAAEQDTRGGSADTMYLTVADDEGNMVSLIQSNYQGFGSGLVVPGLGFALQDRGALFSVEKGAADIYAAGKRPFHTIMPGFATRDDKPWLSFGVMGGNMQPQGQVQVLNNMIDFGMNPQEAGDAARYYHTGSSQPTGEVMTDGGIVVLEAGVCLKARADLVGKGHKLVKGPNGGGYQAIAVENSGGVQNDGSERVYVGASEMRKDGQAAGY